MKTKILVLLLLSMVTGSIHTMRKQILQTNLFDNLEKIGRDKIFYFLNDSTWFFIMSKTAGQGPNKFKKQISGVYFDRYMADTHATLKKLINPLEETTEATFAQVKKTVLTDMRPIAYRQSNIGDIFLTVMEYLNEDKNITLSSFDVYPGGAEGFVNWIYGQVKLFVDSDSSSIFTQKEISETDAKKLATPIYTAALQELKNPSFVDTGKKLPEKSSTKLKLKALSTELQNLFDKADTLEGKKLPDGWRDTNRFLYTELDQFLILKTPTPKKDFLGESSLNVWRTTHLAPIQVSFLNRIDALTNPNDFSSIKQQWVTDLKTALIKVINILAIFFPIIKTLDRDNNITEPLINTYPGKAEGFINWIYNQAETKISADPRFATKEISGQDATSFVKEIYTAALKELKNPSSIDTGKKLPEKSSPKLEPKKLEPEKFEQSETTDPEAIKNLLLLAQALAKI